MNDYVLDRTKAPKAGPIPKVSFPAFDCAPISNRAGCLDGAKSRAANRFALTFFSRWLRETIPRNREGLASSMADLLTKGTPSRNATQIAEEIDFVGGSLSASAGWDAITINVGVLSKYLDLAVDLLADVVQHSTYPRRRNRADAFAAPCQPSTSKSDAGFLSDMVFSQVGFFRASIWAATHGNRALYCKYQPR